MSFLKYRVSPIFLFLLFSQALLSQELADLSKSLDSLIVVDSKESLAMAKKLEKLAKKENSEIFLSKSYATFAKIFFQKESYSKAIKYFEKDLKIRSKNASAGDISEAYYNLANTYVKLNNNEQAIYAYKKTINLMESMK